MSGSDTLPDFSGKCISISLIDETHSHDLYNPYFELQAGRLFIVGKITSGATDSGWSVNQTGAVAWERVESYVLFDNIETYKQAIKVSEDYAAQEGTSEQKENT